MKKDDPRTSENENMTHTLALHDQPCDDILVFKPGPVGTEELMERTAKGYRLSSGREFYANGHLVSIARGRDGTFLIREGYDGPLSGATGYEYEAPDPGELDPNWTAEERRELADFMIAQWTAFKESI